MSLLFRTIMTPPLIPHMELFSFIDDIVLKWGSILERVLSSASAQTSTGAYLLSCPSSHSIPIDIHSEQRALAGLNTEHKPLQLVHQPACCPSLWRTRRLWTWWTLCGSTSPMTTPRYGCDGGELGHCNPVFMISLALSNTWYVYIYAALKKK